MRLKLPSVLLSSVVFILIPGASLATAKVFRAGAAASVITPPLGVSINGHFNDRRAAHVNDELHARVLVLDDGATKLALAICDSCMIPREVMDAAKELISERTHIPATHVLIAATHTHTAPTCASVFQSDPDPAYVRFLAVRIADGVVRACNNLAPAKVGWGRGSEPRQVFNRRWKVKPGTIGPDPFGRTNDLVKMNPPVGSPNLVEPAGPTDPEISVLAVQSASGLPIAVLANYSLHYVGTGRNNEVSADYFGIFARKLERLLGAGVEGTAPFVAMLSNGTSGDVNNINFRVPQSSRGPYEQANSVAEAIVREVHRVYRDLRFQEWVSLDCSQTELSLGVRLPPAEDVAKARTILEAAGARELSTAEEVYARETVLISEYPSEVKLMVQVLRIGELGIAAIPCEVFAETGLAIKRRSAFSQTFTIELANGYNGYLPTPEQHALGGYETWRARSSYLEVQAAPKILNEVLKLLTQLKGSLANGR